MATGQLGIFAVGTPAHVYLELDRRPGTSAEDLVAAVSALEEPHTTVGGVNLVVGFRPSLWIGPMPELHEFAEDLVGPDGFTMPATQRDVFIWIAGAARDLVFDVAQDVLQALDPVATLAAESTGWSYRHSRDLTGFEDGTENPSLLEAPEVALIPDGEPGEGGSVLLIQEWIHDSVSWRALADDAQERVIGRTKPDSVELDEDVMPEDSHVARNVIEDAEGEELEIFRRNVPIGTVSEHGVMFVGFTHDQARLQRMIERMTGLEGPRDALTRYTAPRSGSWYFVPSIEALRGSR